MSDQFCLKWNNHHTTLVAVFDKLFECESLVDCTVAAEGKFVKAHKVVLSACSSYLEELLQNHEDKHPILIFNDISYVELKAMLEYMYRGEVNVSQDQLNTFLKAAEALRIKGLTTDQGGGDGGGGDLNDLKKKMPRKEPRTNSPVLGTTPVERPPSPKRKRRVSSRDENYANDSNSCDTAPTPPPASGHNAVTKLEEKLSRLKREGGGAETPSLPSGTPSGGTPHHKLLQPKTEFVEEPSNMEDVSLEDEEDYGPNPGTSQASFSSQDFNSWQLGEAAGDEVFMAGQHDLNNTAGNSQGNILRELKQNKLYYRGLQKRLEKHLDPRGLYKCALCCKDFLRAASLHRHYQSECAAFLRERTQKCPFCPFQCEFKRTFVEHIIKHHRKIVTQFRK
uniref:Longitudinals lacking protein, isoforms H/M/V n=1 Tax=Lygus hesperus TaxID=30085 RepID=A0A0A9VPN1_LYGHE